MNNLFRLAFCDTSSPPSERAGGQFSVRFIVANDSCNVAFLNPDLSGDDDSGRK